jgi:N-methylhydantoinase A
MNNDQGIRLGADIGGTFTDIALDVRGTLFSTKVRPPDLAPRCYGNPRAAKPA